VRPGKEFVIYIKPGRDKYGTSGQMELKGTDEIWKQKFHVVTYIKETVEPKPTDFYLNSLQVMNNTMY
jgi:hypothetical protein